MTGQCLECGETLPQWEPGLPRLEMFDLVFCSVECYQEGFARRQRQAESEAETIRRLSQQSLDYANEKIERAFGNAGADPVQALIVRAAQSAEWACRELERLLADLTAERKARTLDIQRLEAIRAVEENIPEKHRAEEDDDILKILDAKSLEQPCENCRAALIRGDGVTCEVCNSPIPAPVDDAKDNPITMGAAKRRGA